MKQTLKGALPLLACFLLQAQPILADQFHYNNFLIGDRAIGMGGAYGGVADDASGLFYNPAGLAFALSNDISGSANALYKRKTVYKKAVGNKNFTETSGGTVPSFFGGLQKLDGVAKGLVFAFGMFTTDGDLKDQDDLIVDEEIGQEFDPIDKNTRCNEYVDNERTSTEGGELPKRVLERFHRTVNQRAATFHAGAALGWRMSNNVALGLGLNYVTVDELVQEYQDVRTKGAVCLKNGGFADTVSQLDQNIRQNLTAFGMQPVLAIQTSLFGRLSLGFTAKLGSYVSQRFERSLELRRVQLLGADQEAVDDAAEKFASYRPTTAGSVDVLQVKDETKLKNPLGRMPAHYRIGLGYFATTRLLTTFDVTHVEGVKNGEKLQSLALYNKDGVTNFAAGLEYYLVPSIPVRLGVFTNNDARPKVEKNKVNQRDHIDFLGGTIFLAWVQPNSQIGAGVVLQKGTGEAQKVEGPQIQEVEGTASTFAFSASHSF